MPIGNTTYRGATNDERRERLDWKIKHDECIFPDCERPSVCEPDDTLPMCRPHLEGTNAQADLDEAALAENVLEPWVETMEAIGFPVLARARQGALIDLRREKEELEERIAKAHTEIDEG